MGRLIRHAAPAPLLAICGLLPLSVADRSVEGVYLTSDAAMGIAEGSGHWLAASSNDGAEATSAAASDSMAREAAVEATKTLERLQTSLSSAGDAAMAATEVAQTWADHDAKDPIGNEEAKFKQAAQNVQVALMAGHERVEHVVKGAYKEFGKSTAKKRSDLSSETPPTVAELQVLQLAQLKERARADGVSSSLIEKIDDEENPKEAAIVMIIDAASAVASRRDQFHAELDGLRLSQLKRKARQFGIDEDTLKNVDRHDDPKKAAIGLILSAHSQAIAKATALRTDLEDQPLAELKERGRKSGFDSARLDSLEKEANPKEAAVSLLLKSSLVEGLTLEEAKL